MRSMFSNYVLVLLEVVIGVGAITLLFTAISDPTLANGLLKLSVEQTTTGDIARVSYEPPVVEESDFIVKNAILAPNSDFDWHDYVQVKDSNNNDLINYVVVTGEVDTSQYGPHTLHFSLNWNGKNIEKEATFYVRE